MKKLELLRELNKSSVFNLKKVKEIMNTNNDYAKLVIHRLKKDKLIFEIERNKYTIQKDLFIIASNIIWPSYISCWPALRYYNLTEQLPDNFFIITTKAKKKREIEFDNIKIIFIKTAPKYFFGYKKERYGNFDIFIADREKAIIDSILFKKISISEIYDSIKNNKEEINFDLLINYLIKVKNKTLIKRFGFLLDKLGIDTQKLKKLIDSKYVSLEYFVKTKGEKNKKWKVVENVNL